MYIDTFRMLKNLQRAFDDVYGQPFWNGRFSSSDVFPPVNIYENNDAYIVQTELPGMKKEDIELTVQDRKLTIAGEMKYSAKEDESIHRQERPKGSFKRIFNVPGKIDAEKMSAVYEDGILTITLPKAQEVKAKQITIK